MAASFESSAWRVRNLIAEGNAILAASTAPTVTGAPSREYALAQIVALLQTRNVLQGG